MFTKFWDKLAEGLAGTWNAQSLTPALAFWGGVVFAWLWRYDSKLLHNFLNNVDMRKGIALIVGGLFLLVVSSGIVAWLQLPLLRLAEGYWPSPFKALRFKLVACLNQRLEAKEQHWQILAAKERQGILESREWEEYARLDAKLATYPIDPRRRLPTRLGNLLRAAEEHAYQRYGLEITVVWPRLWLVLPEVTRTELTHARQTLDERVGLLIWGLLFSLWGGLAWWAVPIGLLVALGAYWGVWTAAGIYAELLRSAFDLHRFALYEALRWSYPSKTVEERLQGEQLTQYLFRGPSSVLPVVFKHPQDSSRARTVNTS